MMQIPEFPPDESSRLVALRSLHILDTPQEERFDRLTRIARRMFSVPVVQVSLIDTARQWSKSTAGSVALNAPREVSFCGHTILGNDVLCVNDAREDARFSNNPLVLGDPNIRFYAGCPLQFEGHNVGALCLIDREPRGFSDEERHLLRDLAHMVEEELAAEHLAATDELTGLANRRGYENFAQQMLGVCKRLGKPATLVFFDLNTFKSINDRFGHAEGDRALRIFAESLESVFRESDIAARLGGDEFAVLLTDTRPRAADPAIVRLREWLDAQVQVMKLPYEIEFSAGIIQFDSARHPTVSDLLHEADAAMYENKSAGRL